MTKEQLLLVHIIEECSEVAQRATKSLRFGLSEMQQGQDKANCERLEEEIVDLLSVIDLCIEEGIIDVPSLEIPYNLTLKKRAKVAEYMNYSRNLGVME